LTEIIIAEKKERSKKKQGGSRCFAVLEGCIKRIQNGDTPRGLRGQGPFGKRERRRPEWYSAEREPKRVHLRPLTIENEPTAVGCVGNGGKPAMLPGPSNEEGEEASLDFLGGDTTALSERAKRLSRGNRGKMRMGTYWKGKYN